jgi:hypothetical protein
MSNQIPSADDVDFIITLSLSLSLSLSLTLTHTHTLSLPFFSPNQKSVRYGNTPPSKIVKGSMNKM